MSVITLQFGQCGNQIGQALFSDLYNDIKSDTNKISAGKRSNIDYFAEATHHWFDVDKLGHWEARSILIDTEDKVALSANNNVPYKFKNVVAKSQGGAANNWAFGYSSKSELLMADIVEGVRKEMERCDFVSSVLGILSSAGGTGAGVGSRTMEVLRREYSKKTLVTTVVLPYKSGEIVTQNYNSLLTLAKLYEVADAIFLYENDVMHRMCTKIFAVENITFRDINSIIAQQLAAALQPVENSSVSRIVENLTAHKSYKMIQLRSVPHTSKEHLKYESLCSWGVLINRIKALLKSNGGVSEISRKLKCLGNMLISRGSASPTDEDLRPLNDFMMYVPWLPVQGRLVHYHQPRCYKDLNKFLVLLTNNNVVCAPLDVIVEDTWTLFRSEAYLHHYKKFGVDQECFLAAFDKLEEVLRDYNAL